MKKIPSYHFCSQTNGNDGKADGLMTPGSFHRAFYLLLSVLSIIHKQDFDDIFEIGMFNFKKLLRDAGVCGVKRGAPALMSKDSDISCRLVGSNTIKSCSLEMFVREKGISYEEFFKSFTNAFTYTHDVQELRDYDVSLHRNALEKSWSVKEVRQVWM
ncbi:predicted protein [Chaetoceros tenuissimus]|uniref:Uncharacterized protein n=1 Tax=Chaetoceros tenuissimus TaxID=426638 RepID=A0AAD3D4J6_9STRA|nr:predicted protein [Chaetoceros tenuissimus]